MRTQHRTQHRAGPSHRQWRHPQSKAPSQRQSHFPIARGQNVPTADRRGRLPQWAVPLADQSRAGEKPENPGRSQGGRTASAGRGHVLGGAEQQGVSIQSLMRNAQLTRRSFVKRSLAFAGPIILHPDHLIALYLVILSANLTAAPLSTTNDYSAV